VLFADLAGFTTHFGRAIERAEGAGRYLDGALARIELTKMLRAAGRYDYVPLLLVEAGSRAERMGASKTLGWIEDLSVAEEAAGA
jgi:hypothetical protein